MLFPTLLRYHFHPHFIVEENKIQSSGDSRGHSAYEWADDVGPKRAVVFEVSSRRLPALASQCVPGGSS